MKILGFSFLLFLIFSCQSKENTPFPSQLTAAEMDSTESDSAKVEDWTGSYVGIIPCNGCEGIDLKINLHPSNKYDVKAIYMQPNPKNNKTLEFTGDFTWEEDNQTIIFSNVDSLSNKYKIKGEELLYLNPDSTPNTGLLAEFYALKKQ